jgi:glycosyltransferase involved in cell wall biosynthesis
MKFSIITPNYNYAQFIDELIESIINQNYKNVEHIIVDDGSTDNSVEVIEKYQNKYPDKIKLIKQKNQGQTKALNTALKYATGDILCWINSDDLYCENVFEKIFQYFRYHPELEVVFGNIFLINQQGSIVRENKYLDFDYASGVFNGFGRIIPSNAVFWRTRLTKKTGGFNEDFDYTMDAEYWSRLLYKVRIKHINLPISKWRQHDQTKTFERQKKNSQTEYRANLENQKILEKGYSNLKISNIIPLKYYGILKLFYKAKRLFLRGIQGHYFLFLRTKV